MENRMDEYFKGGKGSQTPFLLVRHGYSCGIAYGISAMFQNGCFFISHYLYGGDEKTGYTHNASIADFGFESLESAITEIGIKMVSRMKSDKNYQSPRFKERVAEFEQWVNKYGTANQLQLTF